jgi:diaminopimelate decarboxylase
MSIGFTRKNAALYCDGLAVSKLAAEYGTPLWLYSQSVLEARYKLFAASLADLKPTICYALKANSNQAVIATFAKLGAGADIVSAGELLRALQAGVPPHKIVFAGVGKSAEEMALALDAGILQFNVESGEELARLSAVAQAQHGVARVALRVNPNVDAKTHKKITTGKTENKFGIEIAHAMALAEQARSLKGIATKVGVYRSLVHYLLKMYHAGGSRAICCTRNARRCSNTTHPPTNCSPRWRMGWVARMGRASFAFRPIAASRAPRPPSAVS